jgi:hypothetical protein
MKERVRQQQDATLGCTVIHEGVLGGAIVGALVMLDAKRTQVVAKRKQPVVLAIVTNTAKHRPSLEHDLLVDVDTRSRSLLRPLAVGDDVNDMLTNG